MQPAMGSPCMVRACRKVRRPSPPCPIFPARPSDRSTAPLLRGEGFYPEGGDKIAHILALGRLAQRIREDLRSRRRACPWEHRPRTSPRYRHRPGRIPPTWGCRGGAQPRGREHGERPHALEKNGWIDGMSAAIMSTSPPSMFDMASLSDLVRDIQVVHASRLGHHLAGHFGGGGVAGIGMLAGVLAGRPEKIGRRALRERRPPPP